MTPDAVLKRYVDVVLSDDIDLTALVELIGTDADLLARWVATLGVAADTTALNAAVAALDAVTLAGIARAQIWAVAPFASQARLSFEQWRSVLAASGVARVLAAEEGLADPDSARLKVLLAISGSSLPTDTLLMELAEFRGIDSDLLLDAHPLIRIFAVVEAYDHHGRDQAALLASELLGYDAERFADCIAKGDTVASALIERTGIDANDVDDWADRLWQNAQLTAFSNVLARQPDIDGLRHAHELITSGVFKQTPRSFLLDEGGRVLRGAAGDDLDDLRIDVARSRSVLAECLRDGASLEAAEHPALTVVDRQLMRRLDTERLFAVPMRVGGEAVGVLVFRLTDDDAGSINSLMEAYAAEIAHWTSARKQEAERVAGMLDTYRARSEKRVREIVHEANNPLSIIRNYLHILELRFADQPAAHEQLHMIGDEIQRATEIIARAVEFPPEDEAAGGAPSVPTRRVDLNALVRRVLELTGASAEASGIVVAEDLAAGEVAVTTDTDRVLQIVTNLMRNAVEALSAGGTVRLTTVTGVYRQGRAGVELIVDDDGPGLPQDVLARLYEPKRSTKGGDHRGLGLHITARLVNEIEGAIDVRTAADRGTAFSVFLPDLEAPRSGA